MRDMLAMCARRTCNWRLLMGKARLLVVEDDIDIGNMLKIYFSGMDFDVDVAVRGSDALEKTKQVLPHLIVLDIMLPDIDGYEVCRNLRTSMRTSHIPVIFLTQKDERSDKLQGLELGADDYITKPFDIEELKLRVQGAIRRSERESLTDPRSGLPAGRLIEEQLRRIIRERGWALLDARVNNFEPFKDVYGFVAGDDVLRFTAMLIGEVVDEIGTTSDFIGHAGGDNFIIMTTEQKAEVMKARLKERFDHEVQTHYNFMDRQQGFVQAPTADGTTVKVPFMTLSVGIVSPSMQSFADIREITELAAEARRQDNTATGG
ncbi:MAG: response regulator [Chloroflexi bacterium]|nr:MAG: response regulator [Chloroflexota bacterium]